MLILNLKILGSIQRDILSSDIDSMPDNISSGEMVGFNVLNLINNKNIESKKKFKGSDSVLDSINEVVTNSVNVWNLTVFRNFEQRSSHHGKPSNLF